MCLHMSIHISAHMSIHRYKSEALLNNGEALIKWRAVVLSYHDIGVEPVSVEVGIP